MLSKNKIRILVVHGPNLNLLGEREPEIYGFTTLSQLNKEIKHAAREKGIAVRLFQSNHEGAIIDFLHEQRKWAQGIVINPGALTHYSYTIRDAISSIQLPAVEVHLSDVHQREAFRKISVIKPVCITQISGKGKMSYIQGMDALLAHIHSESISS